MGELERKLVDRQSKLTLREHIDQVIGIEPELYLADLRDEAILQMLAERCVRACVSAELLAPPRAVQTA